MRVGDALTRRETVFDNVDDVDSHLTRDFFKFAFVLLFFFILRDGTLSAFVHLVILPLNVRR
jgi:hypothetical protein